MWCCCNASVRLQWGALTVLWGWFSVHVHLLERECFYVSAFKKQNKTKHLPPKWRCFVLYSSSWAVHTLCSVCIVSLQQPQQARRGVILPPPSLFNMDPVLLSGRARVCFLKAEETELTSSCGVMEQFPVGEITFCSAHQQLCTIRSVRRVNAQCIWRGTWNLEEIALLKLGNIIYAHVQTAFNIVTQMWTFW